MKTIELGKSNKDVIILLHGGGLSWWNYREQAELLKNRFHIVIPILDGHTGSDRSFTSIEHNAQEIISYIDRKFGGHVLLAGGLSLGGQVLVEMLSQRNSICEFAVIESALVIPMRTTEYLVSPVFSLCYPFIKKRWFAKLQFQSLHIHSSLFEDYFNDSSLIKKEDMVSFLRANSDYKLKDTITDCRAKVLILVGGKERRIMKKSADLLSKKINKSTLEVLPQYNHGDLSINHGVEYAEKLLQLIRAQQ